MKPITTWIFFSSVFLRNGRVADSIMDAAEQQRVSVEFRLKLGTNNRNTFVRLERAFRDDAISRPTYFEWLKGSTESRISSKKSRKIYTRILRHDIATVRSSLLVRRFLAGKQTPIVVQLRSGCMRFFFFVLFSKVEVNDQRTLFSNS